MKRIPQEFITDLIERINIVDVIKQRIPLKKKGHNFFGCCPFHNEKTPSFSVNEKRQMFYCFGCGVSGSAINFVMDYDRLSFPEAIEELAAAQGLSVPYTETNSHNVSSTDTSHIPRQELFTLLEKITRFYQQQLTTDSAQEARHYLTQRGLNEAIIEKYQIGYSPNDWQTTQQQCTTNGNERKLYDLAGMLVTNDNQRSYDRFRGRIMFPIRDRQGHVIGFGGRTMAADDNVKYLNSPETPIFHKGRQLYGLYEALEINRQPPKLLVVEGYMDVVSLSQFGIDYSVAALGTATTDDHIKLLFRATDNVIFCYDGDAAGQRAAWRALNTLLPLLEDGKIIQFTFLPSGEDPDSLIRKEGKEGFEQRLEQSIPLSQFLFDELRQKCDLTSPEGKAKFIASIMPLIQQIRAPYFQLNLKQMLGQWLGVLDITLLDRLSDHNQQVARSTASSVTSKSLKMTPMRLLITLILQNPFLAQQFDAHKSLDQVQIKGIELLRSLIQTCQASPNMTTAALLTHYSDHPQYEALKTLSHWDLMHNDEDIPVIFERTLKALYDTILQQRRDELIAKERSSHLSLEEKQELAQIILVLSKKS